MDAIVYVDQENGTLAAPSIKARQRLHSAPEHLLKTPLKTWLGAPSQSSRKALGIVNKIVVTPAATHKVNMPNIPLAAQQCKVAPQPVGEDYPEIEKCFPYDPSDNCSHCGSWESHELHYVWNFSILVVLLDFEIYCVPEEVFLSQFSLAGLGKQEWPLNVLEEDFSMIQSCLPLSPLKMPSAHCRDDLEAFLDTISELTVDLPSECDS
ncbi:securin isoform X1 [Ictalurus punctatus]|uniref:Securin n=1 Tax=Ictalurus punctatus TaxID=7998 RepID=A0A2D0REF8_ICTPU|nr:securin isoform X1 [Ictalurus punctatus]XP_017328928.1 securin isoform X1 [Ictalurus punctatus]